MGFFRKIVSFFMRDTSNNSEPEEVLKSRDVPINPSSEEQGKQSQPPRIGESDNTNVTDQPVDLPLSDSSGIANITPNPQSIPLSEQHQKRMNLHNNKKSRTSIGFAVKRRKERNESGWSFSKQNGQKDEKS